MALKGYKLLGGKHIQWDETVEETDDNGDKKKVEKTYETNEVVPSETDLVARFGPEKFQLVGDYRKPKERKAAQQEDPERPMVAKRDALPPRGDGIPTDGVQLPEKDNQTISEAVKDADKGSALPGSGPQGKEVSSDKAKTSPSHGSHTTHTDGGKTHGTTHGKK